MNNSKARLNNTHLRRVTNEDLMLIFSWANDSDVRKNSFNQSEISLEEHKSWFRKKLEDENCYFYILEAEGVPVGQIRLDVENNSGYISYSIAREYRSKGFGRLILKALENEIQKENIPVYRLIAEVKIDNIASQKKFTEAGYAGVSLIRYNKQIR